MSKPYAILAEATPGKSFAELRDICVRTGYNRLVVAENGSAKHCVEYYLKAVYLVFLDTPGVVHEIPDNLMFLSPSNLEKILEETGANSSSMKETLEILGNSELVFHKVEQNPVDMVSTLVRQIGDATNNRIGGSTSSSTIAHYQYRTKTPKLGGRTPEENINFYQRFGRFPYTKGETKLVSAPKTFPSHSVSNLQGAVLVFQEKILAVPRGRIKLGNGYEIVVPDDVENDERIATLLYKKGDLELDRYSYFGFNALWKAGVDTVVNYLETMEKIADYFLDHQRFPNVDILTGILSVEDRHLTKYELSALVKTFSSSKIKSVDPDTNDRGQTRLVLKSVDRKLFYYGKGAIGFIVATGRFPNSLEAKRIMNERARQTDRGDR